MKITRENYEPPSNISYAPYNQPKLKTQTEIVNCKPVTYTEIPIPENNVFGYKDIPVGSPYDPPSSWNNELTRGGDIAFRKYGGPPSWINNLDKGGSPTTGEHRKFGEYGGNPITRISPVVIPPTHDLEYWRDNNMISLSIINRAPTQEDMYLSGYAESTCCDYLPEGTQLVPRSCQPIQENYNDRSSSYQHNLPKSSYRGIQAPSLVQSTVPIPTTKENYEDRSSSYQYNLPKSSYRGIQAPSLVQSTVPIPTQENYINKEDGADGKSYDMNNIIQSLPPNMQLMPDHTGMINTDCGYNPNQIFTSSLPSNYPAGNCEQDPALKQFNENLYTQIITPGVYTRNQINEPINSNIGISFQQQFEPTTVTRDSRGLHYLQHDPRIIDTTPVKEQYKDVKPNYDNVYDPRFSGYGTSYRSYLEPVTGQSRFMYDDINAIKMPNYIVRSKIDHLPYADSYGPIQEGSEFGNIHNPHMRYLTQDSWMRDSLDFRNDMTQLLMRKVNSEAWQQRQAPLGQTSLVRRPGTLNR